MGNRGERLRSLAAAVVALATFMGVSTRGRAETVRVPGDAPDIQSAITRAAPGDEVLVAPGRHCGATIDKPVHLRASGDDVVVIGCPAGPALFEGLRAGF
jgi:hypothetical protein